jgi:hypothetical protein
MTTGDKIVWTLGAMFFAGIVGGIFGSKAWLLLCAPLLGGCALVAFATWLANRHFKGLRLW